MSAGRGLAGAAVVAVLVAASAARADDFALNPGAYMPEPLDVLYGGESAIRLVEEELTFRVRKWETDVVARFVFENTRADSTVRQLSGFPDISVEPFFTEDAVLDSVDVRRFDDKYGNRGPLKRMRTTIDGRRVRSEVRLGFVQQSETPPWTWTATDSITGIRVQWHVIELVIPPKGRSTVERRYTAGNGYWGVAGAHFHYITVTGGPWQGTIGKLTANVTLADGLTLDHLVWTEPDEHRWTVASYPPKDQWQIAAPNHLSLVWTDFEPLTDESRHTIAITWQARTSKECDEWDHWGSLACWWKPWTWFR